METAKPVDAKASAQQAIVQQLVQSKGEDSVAKLVLQSQKPEQVQTKLETMPVEQKRPIVRTQEIDVEEKPIATHGMSVAKPVDVEHEFRDAFHNEYNKIVVNDVPNVKQKSGSQMV